MAISQTIFRQYDIRGVVGTDLTDDVAYALGRGYAALLGERNVQGAIAVGRDNRPSGLSLHTALTRGLLESGFDVVDVGVVPTPLLYWALNNEPVVGGIQITGSHNPPEYNGFKLCMGTNSLHGDSIQAIYSLIRDGHFPSGSGSMREVSVIDRYIQDIVQRVGRVSRADSKPIKIVYDCGNGAGALVAPQLFDALGVDSIGLFTESDGSFPNHHPDPTVPENLSDCISEVLRSGAELGIAFDGDADRIGVVDRSGRIIWGDHILLLYAIDALRRTGKGQPIIFDVKCSQALVDGIAKEGGKPVMWKTGHSLIKDKMRELGAPVAGEMSGHMFFSEGFYGHDDALYAAVRLLRIIADSGKRIDELLADVPVYVSTPEIRIDTDEETKFAVMEKAVAHFTASHDVISVDGVRVLFGDGWGLLRASNTQPVIVARYEADSDARLAEIRDEMESWLRQQGISI